MIKLDDDFLADVGLADMPLDQRAAFLADVYGDLEARVGARLSDDLSDAQLLEFESIIDGDLECVMQFLLRSAPAEQVDRLRDLPDAELVELAGSMWLEVNRPDYREVVRSEMEALKKAIRRHVALLEAGTEGSR